MSAIKKITARSLSSPCRLPSFALSLPSSLAPCPAGGGASLFSFSTASQPSHVGFQSGVRPRRSLLYMPVTNPKFIEKATTLDVDTLVFDMEDAVSPNMKQEARVHAQNMLADAKDRMNPRTEIAIRINPCSSGLAEADVNAILSNTAHLPHAICLPKIESASDVIWLSDRIEQLCGDRGAKIEIIGMIETVHGMLQAQQICRANERLTAMIFGGDDYAATVGAIRTQSNHEIAFARSLFLLATKSNGLDSIDIVNINFNFKDAHTQENFVKECVNGFELGFTGKQCIHPSQAVLAQEAFSPSADTIAWAQSVVNANDAQWQSGIGAFEMDGKMIDLATVRQAENVVNRAKNCGLL